MACVSGWARMWRSRGRYPPVDTRLDEQVCSLVNAGGVRGWR